AALRAWVALLPELGRLVLASGTARLQSSHVSELQITRHSLASSPTVPAKAKSLAAILAQPGSFLSVRTQRESSTAGAMNAALLVLLLNRSFDRGLLAVGFLREPILASIPDAHVIKERRRSCNIGVGVSRRVGHVR